MIRILLVLCTLSVPVMAAGQTPVDWQMHVGVLDPGDKVVVRTLEGPTIRGRFVLVDSESITVKHKGRETRVLASAVQSIGRPDRVWNGGGIGFTIGFVAGGLLLAAADGSVDWDFRARDYLVCGALGGAYGFGMGIVIDGIVRGDRPILRRSQTHKMSIAPTFTNRTKALTARVTF